MLLIFLALIAELSIGSAFKTTIPGGQSQRNTRRRQDMARILSSLTEYQSNNNGKTPLTASELDIFVKRYIGAEEQGRAGTSCVGDQFCDPDGYPYQINEPTVVTEAIENALGRNPSFESNNYEIHYYVNAKCGSEEGSIDSASGTRDYAVMYVLEGDGIYCGDNQ